MDFLKTEKNMDSEYLKVCYEIARQDRKKQNEIFDFLKSACNEAEYDALMVGIAYCRIMLYPELKNAMMASLSAMLYEEFNRKEV